MAAFCHLIKIHRGFAWIFNTLPQSPFWYGHCRVAGALVGSTNGFQCKNGMQSRLRSSSTSAVSATWKNLPKKYRPESRDGCNSPTRCSALMKLIRKQADIPIQNKKGCNLHCSPLHGNANVLLLVFIGGLVFVAGLNVSTGAGRSLCLHCA